MGASETARVGHPPVTVLSVLCPCLFHSLPLSMTTFYFFFSWSLVIFLSQTCGGLRLCPGPFLSSIFTHIHSRASFELIVWRHKCPSSLELSPEPRTRHLTACLISIWMSNGHLRFDPPSSSFSQLSKGQASLLLIRENAEDFSGHRLFLSSLFLSVSLSLHYFTSNPSAKPVRLFSSRTPHPLSPSFLPRLPSYYLDQSNLLTSSNKSLLPCCLCGDF